MLLHHSGFFGNSGILVAPTGFLSRTSQLGKLGYLECLSGDVLLTTCRVDVDVGRTGHARAGTEPIRAVRWLETRRPFSWALFSWAPFSRALFSWASSRSWSPRREPLRTSPLDSGSS